MTRAQAQSYSDSSQTKLAIGYALTGAGAAIAASSAIFFYLDSRRRKEETKSASKVRMGASLPAGGGGLVIHGSF
jgi:hypothetical protein